MTNSGAADIIDLALAGGPLYSGRERGRLAREQFRLDERDATTRQAEVIVPGNTYALTSSFFMGLFGKSIGRIGSRREFLDRYRFTMPDKFRENIEVYIDRALRERAAA